MTDALKQFGRHAISGQDRSWPAGLARLAAAAAEPAYATAMRVRNRLYDAGLKRTHDLGRPAVSVGNITTGGTGKTPVVAWLAGRLVQAGRRPAVLLRGYGSTGGGDGDEVRVLRRTLGEAVPVHADPSRVAGAAAVLWDRPGVDLFLLDDAFQHRRAARSIDVVLVNAADPFGHDHVLPRGLLREPLGGLARADALVLTRCDAVPPERLTAIEAALRVRNRTAPIYHCDHVHVGLWLPVTGTEEPVSTLADRPFFAIAGIGDPDALDAQLRRYGPAYAGHRWYADHHRYTADDVAALGPAAGATRLITTEKDWVKLADVLPPGTDVAVLRLGLRFRAGEGDRLLDQVLIAVRPTG